MARCRSQGRSSSSCCGSAGTWRLRTDHCLARDCPPRHPCSCEAWRPPPQRRSCRQRRAQPREPSFCAALIAGRSLHPSPACHRWRWARTAASQPPSSASCSLGLRSNNPASPSSSSVCEKCEAVKAAALCHVSISGAESIEMNNESQSCKVDERYRYVQGTPIFAWAVHCNVCKVATVSPAGRAVVEGSTERRQWPRGKRQSTRRCPSQVGEGHQNVSDGDGHLAPRAASS